MNVDGIVSVSGEALPHMVLLHSDDVMWLLHTPTQVSKICYHSQDISLTK